MEGERRVTHSVSACLRATTCIAYRSNEFRKPPAFTWGSPCLDCHIGTARAMDMIPPEPDLEPKPLRDAGKVKAPPSTCTKCGKVISRGSSLCKKHWGLSRRVNHATCSVGKCRWKARRIGMCQSHYWKYKHAQRRASA
jgi:hypothetical protein